MQGLKWESPENVGTKSGFSPNINYNYIISIDYHDNLFKRMRNLKLKNFSCTKINQENIMHNNNNYKDMDHFKKE